MKEKVLLYLHKVNARIAWSMVLKRLVYIVGTVGLCWIDQMIGSATGYIQYGYKNYTGIILGVFMLTAYSIKDFWKLPYLIWIVVFTLFHKVILGWLELISFNPTDAQTNLIGVGLYGILLIRMIYQYVIERKKSKVNWIFFAFGMLMLLGMAIIRTDYEWPKCLFGTFLFFYLTDFKEKDLNNLFAGMMEGIIIGFLMIQGAAWMYRPYDMVRYEGMYSHPNPNALLYLCAYGACLCKWYLMKLRKQFILLRAPFVLLAGLAVATMLYTGSRSAFIAAIVVTGVFLIAQLISRKKLGILEFLADGILIVMAISICVLPAYWMIRYIPAAVNEPLYFEADYGYDNNGAKKIEKKVAPNESITSGKYIEFDRVSSEVFERYLWFLDDETQVKVEEFIREFPDRLKQSLKVEAADVDVKLSMPGESKENPLVWRENQDGAYDVRLEIYDYFLKKLKLIGEKNNVQGVWITKGYLATHCHNLFIQMAYDFGLIIGFWYIGVVVLLYVCVLIGLFRRRTGAWYFRLFVATMFTTIYVVFGMFENVWIYGQLIFTMYYVVLYMVFHQDVLHLDKPKKASGKHRSLSGQESEAAMATGISALFARIGLYKRQAVSAGAEVVDVYTDVEASFVEDADVIQENVVEEESIPELEIIDLNEE